MSERADFEDSPQPGGIGEIYCPSWDVARPLTQPQNDAVKCVDAFGLSVLLQKEIVTREFEFHHDHAARVRCRGSRSLTLRW